MKASEAFLVLFIQQKGSQRPVHELKKIIYCKMRSVTHIILKEIGPFTLNVLSLYGGWCTFLYAQLSTHLCL